MMNSPLAEKFIHDIRHILFGYPLKNLKKIGTVTLLLTLGFAFVYELPFTTSTSNPADNLVIKGLVSNPLNLTYGEVEMFPIIWEIAQLQCVGASVGTPYNWTGVPLFYLLFLADLQPGAEEVVFRAEDGFSSSLTLDNAMHPTTILALKVNGTTLPYEDDYWIGGLAGGYPYKVIVPCKWGYKWVGWIDEIEVVDYDYKGTYESSGFPDEADIGSCIGLPTTTPAYTVFNATYGGTYTLTVFANTTILEAGFNQTVKNIYFTICSDNNSQSFVYVIIPKQLLTENFTVLSNNTLIQHSIIQSEKNSFLYFTLNPGVHAVEIRGMNPYLEGDVNHDGWVEMMDFWVVSQAFGSSPEDSNWNPDADVYEDGVIEMMDFWVIGQHYGEHTL
jgi:hypothetical protein